MRGARYAVLKNPGGLTDRQSATLDAIKNANPRGRLYRAWQLKELLRTLLKHPIDQATTELNRWMFWASHSRIPEIVELARKIRRRGLRLPPREQPHRLGHALLRRIRHTMPQPAI